MAQKQSEEKRNTIFPQKTNTTLYIILHYKKLRNMLIKLHRALLVLLWNQRHCLFVIVGM